MQINCELFYREHSLVPSSNLGVGSCGSDRMETQKCQVKAGSRNAGDRDESDMNKVTKEWKQRKIK